MSLKHRWKKARDKALIILIQRNLRKAKKEQVQMLDRVLKLWR